MTVEHRPGTDWDHWIGRRTESADLVTPELVRRFRATLDLPSSPLAEGEAAPLGIHWCLAPQAVEPGRLGQDGHPRKGEFLPDIPLPRRMWAGGRLSFRDELRIGDRVTRVSEIVGIKEKTGKSGTLAFVTVSHRVSTERGPAIDETQDIVYRAASAGRPDTGAPPQIEPMPHSEGCIADSVLLFRYSALTFNGHRIHYDQPYATGEEGYDGIVVHGPLQATLLMDLAGRIAGRLESFEFRGLRPLMLGAFRIEMSGEGPSRDARVVDSAGFVTTSATVRCA